LRLGSPSGEVPAFALRLAGASWLDGIRGGFQG